MIQLKSLVLSVPCKAHWAWTGAVAKCLFGHVLIAARQGLRRRDAVVAGEEQLMADVQRGSVNVVRFML
jgi:hypothetical protein